MIETGSALLIVLASIALLRAALVRARVLPGANGRGALEVLESRALSARQRICLVEVDGQRLLLGSGEGGVRLLARLEPVDATTSPADAPDATRDEPGLSATPDRSGPGRPIRLHRLLRAFTALTVVLLPAVAWGEGGAASPAISIQLPGMTGPGEISSTLEIVALMTLVSVAPSILLMATCFARVVIVLAFLRQAIGLQQLPPNQVLVGLALFTSLFVMAPVGEQIHADAYVPYVAEEIDAATAAARAQAPIRHFLLAHTREDDLDLFLSMRGRTTPVDLEDVSLMTVLPAFMISELKTAFEIGFLVYLPFLVVDLVIASMLISMGMIVLPPIVISLPFKLMLFVLMDGWNRVIGSLVTGLQ